MTESLKDKLLEDVFFQIGYNPRGNWEQDDGDTSVTYSCMASVISKTDPLYCVVVATPADPVTKVLDESRARYFRLSLTEVPKP